MPPRSARGAHTRKLVFRQVSRQDIEIYNGALSWSPGAPPAQAVHLLSTPSALALQASDSLTLPSPVVNLNPSSFSVVNLSSWLWIDPQIWHSFRATATAGGVSATAVAVPESVSWSMGDGHTRCLQRPRNPVSAGDRLRRADDRLLVHIPTSSAGQPSDDGSDPNEGAFRRHRNHHLGSQLVRDRSCRRRIVAPLHTSSTAPVRVEQVEIRRNRRLTARAEPGSRVHDVDAPRSAPAASTDALRFVGNGHRRRPVVAIASLALVTSCVAIFTSIYLHAGNRVAVLAVAKDVPQGHVITSGDLGVVRISISPGLSPVPAGEISRVVGRMAAVSLVRGTLITLTELTTHAFCPVATLSWVLRRKWDNFQPQGLNRVTTWM